MYIYMYIEKVGHNSIFPLEPPATRRLCESWRLITCIYIILCIFLEPQKNAHRNRNYRTELLKLFAEHAIIEQNW